MMKLTFRFLGRFSEDLSDVDLEHDFDDGLAVGQLRGEIAALVPESADRLKTCMVAVNTNYVNDDQVLKEGDEVAFLPPVSGG